MRRCAESSVCALLAATIVLASLGTAAAVQNATAEASPTLRLLFVGNSLLHYSGSAYKAGTQLTAVPLGEPTNGE